MQLRTHSVYAPYIDQDLQNRSVLFPGRSSCAPNGGNLDGGTLAPTLTLQVPFHSPEMSGVKAHRRHAEHEQTHSSHSKQAAPDGSFYHKVLQSVVASDCIHPGLAMVASCSHRLQLCHRGRIQGASTACTFHLKLNFKMYLGNRRANTPLRRRNGNVVNDRTNATRSHIR